MNKNRIERRPETKNSRNERSLGSDRAGEKNIRQFICKTRVCKTCIIIVKSNRIKSEKIRDNFSELKSETD